MRSNAVLPLFLVFLHACTAKPGVHDAGPPKEASGSPAALTASPRPATAAEPPVEKSYRSPVSICVDAALRVCREREIHVRSQERSGDQSASLRGQARSYEFVLAFSRTPQNRTRAVVQLEGRASTESRDEAARLLTWICEALLEPRD